MWSISKENLNSAQDPPHFILDKRAVCNHIGIRVKRFKRQREQALRESGTTPERTELDAAIEQTIAMEESADSEQQELNDENREKLETDRKKAEDAREIRWKQWETHRKEILKKEVLEQRRAE